MKLRRGHALITVLAILVLASGWLYWNRTVPSDLSTFAPADAYCYVETNDLAALASGLTRTDAWKALAGPIGAPNNLAPGQWLIRLARFTGIGSTDTVLFARSQVAIVLSGAEGSQQGSTLTIKPLTTFVIDTHTSQRRMRATVERHLEDFARRAYANPVYVRKQIGGNDFQEWQSSDGSHVIVFVFADTVVIVGNDEASVSHSLEAHNGIRGSLSSGSDYIATRQRLDAATAQTFGYVTHSGVKPLLQAYALYRSGSSTEAVSGAQIFGDTIGGLISSIGWTSRFVAGGIEDHCSIALAEGVADKMRSSMVPDHSPDVTKLPLIPFQAQSVSVYQFHDLANFWLDLNATVSAHTDLVGAIAARPVLRALVKPYGVDDADTFARAVGPKLQTVRLEKDSPAVLIAEVFDRQLLLKAIAPRFGPSPKLERVAEGEIMRSLQGDWAAAFAGDTVLIGPVDALRACVNAQVSSQSLTSNAKFQKSQSLIDVSLPLSAITFGDDQHNAITFVESFASQGRPAFAANASAIDVGTKSLPFAVSVSYLKSQTFEWTSRSSFGLLGSLTSSLMPVTAK